MAYMAKRATENGLLVLWNATEVAYAQLESLVGFLPCAALGCRSAWFDEGGKKLINKK